MTSAARDSSASLLAVLRFTLALAVLSLPWPGVERAIGAMVSTLAQAFSELTSLPAGITLAADSSSDWTAAVEVYGDAAHQQRIFQFPTHLRRTTFVPIAVFVASAIAARVWLRQASARLGLALLCALASLVCLSVVVPLSVVCYVTEQIRLPTWLANGLVSYWRIISSPTLAYAIPALVCFALLAARDLPVPAGATRSQQRAGDARPETERSPAHPE